MSTLEEIKGTTISSQADSPKESNPTTKSRFYVRKWYATKGEMEEVRSFIRENRKKRYSKSDQLSDRRVKTIRDRIIRK